MKSGKPADILGCILSSGARLDIFLKENAPVSQSVNFLRFIMIVVGLFVAEKAVGDA